MSLDEAVKWVEASVNTTHDSTVYEAWKVILDRIGETTPQGLFPWRQEWLRQ